MFFFFFSSFLFFFAPPPPHPPAVFLQLDRLARGETAENEVEQKRKLGDTVIYGHEIQFMHVLSGRYLAVDTDVKSATEQKYAFI